MRIPSAFNEDNLYRPGRASTAGGSSPTRRVFRLTLALVLIVLVMRGAARSDFYEPFFPALTSGGSPAAIPTGISAKREPGNDPFTAALDRPSVRAAIANVVDGTVWRSEDREALLRLLDGIGEGRMLGVPVQPPAVGPVVLLQQPDVYRGRPVRIMGNVLREESIPLGDNEFGLSSMRQLWIETAGAAGPVVVLLRENAVVNDEKRQGRNEMRLGSRTVTVDGVFLKRWAYRSVGGLDVAPVVVGSLADRPVAPSSLPTTPAPPFSRTRLSLVLGGTLVLGIAIAALVMWRASVVGRQLRRLRTRSQPDRLDWSVNE